MPRRPVRLIAVLALGVALVLAVGGLAGPSAAATASRSAVSARPSRVCVTVRRTSSLSAKW